MRKPSEVHVAVGTGAGTTALVYRSDERASAALMLGHGAGAGQHSTFMVEYATALSLLGLDVITFNFLYTEQRRHMPDRAPVLEDCYRAAIEAARANVESARRSLFIGGKSMGGRMATHVAAQDAAVPVAGLVLLGYPLHPPGQPEKLRDAHLPSVKRPALFVQGSRDTFGTPDELGPILARMTPAPTLHVIEGGDHSFKVSKSKKDPGRQAAIDAAIQRTIASWITAGGT